MQKLALLIAVLSLGAGCASQGTSMSSRSDASTSVARYPGMTYQGGGETMRRDAAGNVIIETPSTVAQYDPGSSASGNMRGASSGTLNKLDQPDINMATTMDADRSVDEDISISASGSAAGSEIGTSMDADVMPSSQSQADIADPDRQTSDDLHSGSATWSSNSTSNSNDRAEFESAIATDDVTEASGSPAAGESQSGSSATVDVDDIRVEADKNSGSSYHYQSNDNSLHRSDKIQADSSIRGGSDRARNVQLRNMETETSRTYLEDSRIKADSSIRGGSDRARGIKLREMESEPVRSFTDKNRIKADSSVRGASAQARGTDRLWMSGNQPSDVPQGRVTSNEPDWLHKSNPAQGTPAPAQSGVGSAFVTGPTSVSIADRVQQSLMQYNRTAGLPSNEVTRNIKVSEHNGTVVLSGSVPDETTSRIIERRAGEVRGVKAVENRLIINRDSLPSERETNPEVQIEIEKD